MTRALKVRDVRAIVRAHPGAFAEIASVQDGTHEEIAGTVPRVILAHPPLLESCIAAGTGKTPEEVRAMGWLARMFTIIAIAQATAKSPDAFELRRTMLEEMAGLVFPRTESLQ